MKSLGRNTGTAPSRFKPFGGMIDWAARKQATVSRATTEAELLHVLRTGKQTMWRITFFHGINLDLEHGIVLQNDKTQPIRLLKSEQNAHKASNYAPMYHNAEPARRLGLVRWRRPTSLLRKWSPTASPSSLPPAQKHAAFTRLLNWKDLADKINWMRRLHSKRRWHPRKTRNAYTHTMDD